jgi:predicted negative regulator of RcsB-dependent stress response
VRAETRHQLKQDKFSRATIGAAEATVHWSAEHKSKLLAGAVILLVLAGAFAGAWYYLNQEDQKASAQLTQAVRTLDTPLRPAGAPAEPDYPTFASAKERATEAHKQFQAVVDKYAHTRSSEVARYFLGLTSSQLGDNAGAERDLKAVTGSGNAGLSAVARLALASVYRNTNRNKEAVDLYNQLIAKPASTVSKAMAQLELAATYQLEQQPAEAKRVYEQVQKENPNSEAAQIASSRLQELK